MHRWICIVHAAPRCIISVQLYGATGSSVSGGDSCVRRAGEDSLGAGSAGEKRLGAFDSVVRLHFGKSNRAT